MNLNLISTQNFENLMDTKIPKLNDIQECWKFLSPISKNPKSRDYISNPDPWDFKSQLSGFFLLNLENPSKLGFRI